MKNVAFIGIGKMGAQMAARLVSAGFQVTVFDPNRSAVDELVSKGAAAAANPKSAAEGADAVLFSLPTPAILKSAITGADGVLASLTKGAILIDFSTVDPETTKALAAEAAKKGVDFLDAPVSGGVAGATNGKLVVMVGGDAAVLERVTPMLNNLAGRIVHCGAIGAGQLTKLSHNLVVAINTVALGEVLAASVKAGGNLEVLCDVMSAGMAGSKMLDWFQKTLFTAERPAFFAIDLMNKDLGLCLDEFSDYPMPLGQLVKQTYNAARAKGMGGKDSTSVSEIYEELLGVRLQAAA
ncbi:2-hydroxy-3-oxopropionate reductase [Variovorax sp. V118]|uniref:NAD(P)-dependent oxidoreductase n=1 Tax=Variovorax sp. V118 TaxID=3065954 RepID=UPI0034E8E1AD